MAKETIVKLIDDLDGGAAAETVTFGLDGHSYEIDLSAKNATKLRTALLTYLEHGTRESGPRPLPVARRRQAHPPKVQAAVPSTRDQNLAVRAWAERNGYEVALRGRIKQDIVDLYQANAGR